MKNSTTKLKIVITGASGFIGGHLIGHLSALGGVEIIPLSRKKLPNLIQVSSYENAPEGDVLIHLAEDSVLWSVENQKSVYEKRALGTLNGLLSKHYKSIIYASSSTLYGDKSKKPHTTEDEVFVDSRYAQIKRMSENAVTEHPGGIVVRLANVYGPRMSGKNVISEILSQIPDHGDIVVVDSTPVRDFVWVEDIVEGISKLALMDKAKLGESKMYNLGTGVGSSISELAQSVLDLINQPERRVVSKNPIGLASSIVLDYSSTTNACGWVPQTSLREGLRSLLFSSGRFNN